MRSTAKENDFQLLQQGPRVGTTLYQLLKHVNPPPPQQGVDVFEV